MFIRIQNATGGPLWCGPERERAVLIPSGDTTRVEAAPGTPGVTVWHTYGSRMDGESLHVVLDSTFTFSSLQEGDTVELYREHIAAAKTGIQGYVWYDRVFAWCRVADRPAERHTVAGEDAARQAILAQYREDMRWSVLWESLLDVWWEWVTELGGCLLLFVLLWMAYGFLKALLIALAALVGLFVLTAGFNWLLFAADHRKTRNHLLAFLEEATVTAYYAMPDRVPVDGQVQNR